IILINLKLLTLAPLTIFCCQAALITTFISIAILVKLYYNNIHNIFSVTKTVQRIRLENGKSKVIIGTPKTKSSIRKVYMPSFLVDILKSYKSSPELFILSGKPKPKEPRVLQYRFKIVIKKLNMNEFSFHSLRHTYASMCIEKGFDPKTLSELLGHADVNITLNTYVHSSDSLKKKYVKRLMI
ncbi:MAG: site-specific integrase, partial [Oscillospiraceae bacterium]|nr:site-specific integrase [Oscillospiraceae bacterium]